MMPRGYGDLYQRLRDIPGRLWCVTFHRKMLKVWRVGYARYNGLTSMIFLCRICGRQYTGDRW
jgi:hypothetical protein